MDKRPTDVLKPLRESVMTPEHQQELHDKADRILETDQADLLVALMDALYQHVMKDRKR